MNKPDLCFEKELWKRGLTYVAGCDEVGRGCFAGPVVAAACIFSEETSDVLDKLPLRGVKINDSKKLTPLQREKADSWIRKNCLAYGVGVGVIAEINKFGIKKATDSAFRRAVNKINNKLTNRVDFLLIDAFYIPYIRGIKMPSKKQKDKNKKLARKGKIKFHASQLAIEKGDQISVSIAAASIIAKVYRDKLMVDLSKKYKIYGWDKNKGYGTKEHRNSIMNYGVTKHHRTQYVETFIRNFSSSQVLSET